MKQQIVWMRGMPSPNRVGSSIWKYIGILIRAHKRKFLIKKIYCKYSNTLLCSILNQYINDYNKSVITEDIDSKNYQEIDLTGGGSEMELLTLPLLTVNEIKIDMYSYFREHFFKNMTSYLRTEITKRNFVIPKNWKKRVCIHLRLDDCANGQHSIDYDGTTSHNFFVEKINKDDSKWNWNGDYEEYFRKNNIKIIGRGKSTYQSPIPYNRIETLIDSLKKEYINHEIVIVASPIGGEIPLNYKHIRSKDPDLDLFYMIYNDVLVCSRSTFSMVAAFLHQGSKIIIPKWGYSGASGLESKYDKSGINCYY